MEYYVEQSLILRFTKVPVPLAERWRVTVRSIPIFNHFFKELRHLK
jgi:hypothetical protein